MKVLSIRQPWAWLIINAGKDIENRTWYTPFRGRCLIHASKGCTRQEWTEAYEFATAIRPDLKFRIPSINLLDRGGIVGQMEITDCTNHHSSPWFGGPWGFVIAFAIALPFQPCMGALRFFDYEIPETKEAVCKEGK